MRTPFPDQLIHTGYLYMYFNRVVLFLHIFRVLFFTLDRFIVRTAAYIITAKTIPKKRVCKCRRTCCDVFCARVTQIYLISNNSSHSISFIFFIRSFLQSLHTQTLVPPPIKENVILTKSWSSLLPFPHPMHVPKRSAPLQSLRYLMSIIPSPLFLEVQKSCNRIPFIFHFYFSKSHLVQLQHVTMP